VLKKEVENISNKKKRKEKKNKRKKERKKKKKERKEKKKERKRKEKRKKRKISKLAIPRYCERVKCIAFLPRSTFWSKLNSRRLIDCVCTFLSTWYLQFLQPNWIKCPILTIEKEKTKIPTNELQK
jgi:hypothetical protein